MGIIDIRTDDLGSQIELVFTHDYQPGIGVSPQVFGRLVGVSHSLSSGDFVTVAMVRMGETDVAADLSDPGLRRVAVNGDQRYPLGSSS